MNVHAQVQHETDILILVDKEDNQVGSLEKRACHLGSGRLHRAFSVFLFDPANRLLIQQRSPGKMLWGGCWSNSCCSHPRLAEKTEDAAHRRIHEELGVVCVLQYLYKFIYRAEFGSVGSEYELCWVYAGYFDGKLKIDPTEISATRFIAPDELSADLTSNTHLYTPWLKLEWDRLRQDFPFHLTMGNR